jgi:hypothetical protein
MPTATEVSERLARLATWKPGGGRTVAPEDRLPVFLLVAGAICMPLGLIVVLLGWWGAAHTPFGFEQTPYLISGGILGLALVVAGGFVYFAYWQTLRVRESREQTEAVTDALARLEALLASGATTTGGTSAGVTAGFVATPSGSIYHRPDCTVVAGRTDLAPVNPARTKLEPCRICNPAE